MNDHGFRGLLRRWIVNLPGAACLFPAVLASSLAIAGVPTTGWVADGMTDRFFLKNDGSLWSSGENTYGELGDGTFLRRLAPVPVSGLTNVQGMAGGLAFSMAVKTDGTVWSWGDNLSGNLGDGTYVSRNSPGQIPGISNGLAVAAGWVHGVLLKTDGTVWTWGSNWAGQLGDGTIYTLRNSPVQVVGLTGAVAISSGSMHTLALKSDGTVWGWGRNLFGQLGDGTSMNNRLSPVQVSGLNGVVSIAAGDSHSVAVKSDGTVWIWGLLPDGMAVTPVQVSDLAGITAVAAGDYHTLALKNNGTVWSWGTNVNGQLGDGTRISRSTPVQVVGVANAVAVFGSMQRTSILKSDGVVVAWGANDRGHFGDGATDTLSFPVQVGAIDGVSSVAAGTWTTLAVKSGGTIWGWGDNYYGQLGDGTKTGSNQPVQATGISGVTVATIGPRHSAAIKSDATLWSWGDNYYGQLGDGTTTERLVPTQVSSLTGMAGVAAGENFTVALKSNGTVYTWGYNASGQLGDGTTTDHATPALLSGIAGITAVATGYSHAVALKSDGTVWSWGLNDKGQLGDGTTTNRSSPVQVSGLSGVTAVAAAGHHGVALKNDGTVWAWGFNEKGHLGDGTTTNRSTPVQVGGFSGMISIGAGAYSTLGIKSDGSLWMWGGAFVAAAPIQVPSPGVTFQRTAGGYDHAVALKSDGTLWTWGGNPQGQFGLTLLRPSQAAIRLIPNAADSDQDGISDSWEIQHFGNLSRTGGDDADGDGLTDIQEFLKGTNPVQANPDGDRITDFSDPYPNDYYNNLTPTLTILGGNNQSAPAGQFNAQPFDVAVWNGAGTAPLVNAPVAFTVTQGGGLLATTTAGNPTLFSTGTVRTDGLGTAQVFYKQPAGSAVQSQITAAAGSAPVVTFLTQSTGQASTDTDGDGLPDTWEMQYFGGLSQGANGDPDGDGLTNAQELAAQSNPLDFYNGRAFTLVLPTDSSTVSYIYDASGRLTGAMFGGFGSAQYTLSGASNLSAVASTPTPIVAWRQANNLPSNGIGSGADSTIIAGDGLPNLAKYAFALLPGSSVTTDQPRITLTRIASSDYLTLTFRRPHPAPLDIIYTVEVSIDGQTWTSGASATVDISTTITGAVAEVTVRDFTSLSTPSFGRRVRLKLQRTAQ